MQKALIYCRVSSQRQVNEGHGIDSQEKRCRDYANSRSYKVIRVFPDEGISGGLFERPAMQALIKYIDENPTEKYVIIFDDISRLARDLGVHLRLVMELCKVRGAVLESPNFKFEDSPEGKFIEHVIASKAELDREQNRRQVIQKMKARLERGYWPFMLPFGLVNEKNQIHGKLAVPREPHASIYKEAIEKYRDGILTKPDDVRVFINEGYKLGNINKTISLTASTDLLTEILYTGYIEYTKWNIPLMKAKHEGFISLETYTAVQARLQDRTKPWKRRDYSQDFPLRPHVLCSACNKPMTASYCTGRGGKRYPNYFCRIKGCIYNWKTVRKDIFESRFETLLEQVKPLGGVVDLAKDVLQEQWELRLETHAERRQKAHGELEESKVGIEAYLKLLRKTNDDELRVLYESEIKKLRKQQVEIEKNLGKQQYTSEQFGTATEKVFNTLKKPVSMWKSPDYNDKRTILFMYFEDQLRYDYKMGFGTEGLAYPIKLMADIESAKNGSVEMSGSDPESENYFLKTSTSVVD